MENLILTSLAILTFFLILFFLFGVFGGWKKDTKTNAVVMPIGKRVITIIP